MTLLIAAGVALGPLSMLIYLPVLPAVQADFGATPERTQLTFSIFILAMGIAQLFLGSWSDRFGRRPIVLAGGALFVLGNILAATAANIEMLIVARAVQAAGGGAGLVVSRAILADLFPPEEMAKRFATIVLIMMIGPTLGPIVGAEIAAAWDWRGIFWILAIAGTGVFFLMLAMLPETLPPEARSPRSLWAGISLALSRRRFVAYVILASCSVASYFLFISNAPLLMFDMFGTTAQTFGRYFLYLSAAYALGNIFATRWGPGLGITGTIWRGSVVGFVGAIAMVVCYLALPPHELALFLPMALVTFSNGFCMPSIQSAAVAQVPERRGAASSVISFLMQVFGAIVIQLVAFAPTDDAGVMASAEFLLVGSVLILAALLVKGRGPKDPP